MKNATAKTVAFLYPEFEFSYSSLARSRKANF
jgi:hypothetical protein